MTSHRNFFVNPFDPFHFDPLEIQHYRNMLNPKQAGQTVTSVCVGSFKRSSLHLLVAVQQHNQLLWLEPYQPPRHPHLPCHPNRAQSQELHLHTIQ